jgi:hypothetical protein
METDPEIARSGWIFEADLDEVALATAIERALVAPTRPPPDLHRMSWESRNREVEQLCLQHAGLGA